MTTSTPELPGFPRIESPLFALLEREGLFGPYGEAARQLQRFGYVVVDLGRDTMAAMAARIRADLQDQFDLDAWRGSSSQGGLRVQDAWQQSAAVRELALWPSIHELLATCWGREPFAFQTLNFPVGTQQHFHSDAVHFHSEPAGFMCGVWVALEDIHADAGPLEYYPGSQRLPYLQARDVGYRQQEDASPDQTLFHPYWNGVVRAQGLERELFTPRLGQALIWTANLLHGGAPVRDHRHSRWSQVTHYFFEGCRWYTPMLSDWPDGPVAWRQPLDVRTGDGYRPKPPLGHLDQVWSLGSGRYVLAGWCTNSAADALLNWVSDAGAEGSLPLGPVRLRRPDVNADVGLGSAEADLGFLVAVEVPAGHRLSRVQLGASVLEPVAEPLFQGDGLQALEQLVDACHWGSTPPEHCSGLLAAPLGQALTWLIDAVAVAVCDRSGPECGVPVALRDQALVLELNDDPQLARCRFWALQQVPALASGAAALWIRPASGCLWGHGPGLPAGLQSLAAMAGLAAQRLPEDSLASRRWVVMVAEQAPLHLPAASLMALFQACSSTDRDAQLRCEGLEAVVAVPAQRAREAEADLLRAAGPGQNLQDPDPLRPSRRRWLRAIRAWMAQR